MYIFFKHFPSVRLLRTAICCLQNHIGKKKKSFCAGFLVSSYLPGITNSEQEFRPIEKVFTFRLCVLEITQEQKNN